MVKLNFTLSPEAAGKVHAIVACLGRFSDLVSMEARQEKVGSDAETSN